MELSSFKQAFVAVNTLAFIFLSTAQADPWDFGSGQWLDLSHAYDENTIYWPTAPVVAFVPDQGLLLGI